MGNPEIIATLDVTKIAGGQNYPTESRPRGRSGRTLKRIKKPTMSRCRTLKKLEDAGVTIAAGTDAGNIGTIHGPALFREFQLMKEAGLTPCKFSNRIRECRKTLWRRHWRADRQGRKGLSADLVILNSNPLDDIAHASDIDMVIKNGVVYPADSILH